MFSLSLSFSLLIIKTLFFSKQFHFISPITSYIIVFLYVVKYHYNHIVNVYNSTLNGMYDTPIGMCKTHKKYRCASYTSNGVLAGTNIAHHIWCVGHTLFFTVNGQVSVISARDGSSTLVLVLKSALSTFLKCLMVLSST